jgi:hypothetical protein
MGKLSNPRPIFIFMDGGSWDCICMDGGCNCGWDLDDFLNTKKYNNNATATTATKTPPAIHIFLDDMLGLEVISGSLI